MAFSFLNTENGILYQEQKKPVLRIFISAFGLLMLVFSAVFVELIFHMGTINTPAKAGGVVASVIGLIAFILFGGYCLRLMLFMPDQILLFDKKNKQLDYTTHSPAKKTTQKIYPFTEIIKLEVIEYPQEDGPTTFSLSIVLANNEKIYFASYETRDQANQCITRINRVLS